MLEIGFFLFMAVVATLTAAYANEVYIWWNRTNPVWRAILCSVIWIEAVILMWMVAQ